MSSPEAIKSQRLKHLATLLFLSLLVFLPGLANMPVIDRDEARYAQASVQMAESGDLLNIRFQDEARNKKPAGIYWLQTGALKIFSNDSQPKIWAVRLPSVFGALLAVFALYWGAARMIGRNGAFIAAGMLALSMLMIFEAHIAKTDAILCGLSALCLGALAHIRNGGGAKSAWVFWTALGAAIMIKGPVLPILATLTLITLALWERRNGWMRTLVNLPAIIVFLLLWVPWAIAIYRETDGAFFTESLGKDFGGKLISAQENHAGPPGYYLGTIWLTFWPACLLLIPGFAFAARAIKNSKDSDAPVIKAMRLCAAWIFPYWILIELVPTKLPHYPLPLFPALSVICAVAALTLIATKEFSVTRRINAVLFLLASLVFIGSIMAAQSYFGDINMTYYILAGASGFCAIIATFALWQSHMKLALITAALSTLILSIPSYQFIMPGLTELRVADKVVDALRAKNIKLPREGGPDILSINFTEPSLVYRLGARVKLGKQGDYLDMNALKSGRIILIDEIPQTGEDRLTLLMAAASSAAICLDTDTKIEGFNYAKGDEVKINLIRQKPCTP